jgi:hypothetical protein
MPDTPTLEEENLSIDGEALEESELADGPEILAPNGMDQGELLDGLFRDLRRGEHAKSVMVEAEMRRIIEASQSLGEARFIEGLGQTIARVPTAVFHHWGQRYGYEIWNNPGDLIAHLERLNPGFMVRSRGKTQVVVDGRRDQTSAGCRGTPADPVENSQRAAAVKGTAAASRGVRGGRWGA